MLDVAHGLTQAGMARLNQSIEAFVYCILGSQVNVRSSILGNGGRAKEAQREFLILMEDAIHTPDISKSVQRYQLAVDEAKVRLNLAVAPGCWLMPSNMVLNSGSVVGYNNKLKQATPRMKLGVNNDVNQGTKKAALHLMAGGPSKVNQPNSHPSNPIHKAAMKAQNPAKTTSPPSLNLQQTTQPSEEEPTPPADSGNDTHNLNKIVVALGALVIAGVVFFSIGHRKTSNSS